MKDLFPLSASLIRNLFAWIVVFFCIWSILFIWNSSFLIGTTRYYCLVDDAMVSMRYARNLASNLGPVWNAGEYVEGYTNPLWMLVMAGVHLFRLPSNLVSLPVQLLSVILLVINLFGIRRLGQALAPQESLRNRVGVCAALLTAVIYPLNYWSLMGMEVGLVACLVTWSCTLAVESLNSGKFSILPWLLLALSTLVRIDSAVLFLSMGLACAWLDPVNRRRILGWSVLLGSTFLIGQTLVRWSVYGDFLPNTYYLKMTGFPALLRISRGAFYTALSLFCFPVFLLIYGIIRSPQYPQRRLLGVPLATVAGGVFYSMYTGGDAWERVLDLNRFLSPIAPLIAVSVAVLLSGFFMKRPLIAMLVFTAGFALWRSTSPADLFVLRPPVDRADNIRNLSLAMDLRQIVPTNASIAVEYAGTMPYFMPEYRMIDLLGKSDKHVARTAMHRGFLPVGKWREFYPGHLKWDYAYSIKTLRPDVICAIWKKNYVFAEPFLSDYRKQTLRNVDVYFK